MAKTRKELYEELKNVQDGYREFTTYMDALTAFTEHMDALNEKDENGRQKPITAEQRAEAMKRFNEMDLAYRTYGMQLSHGKSWQPEQEKTVSGQMKEMHQKLTYAVRPLQKYDPSKGEMTMNQVRAAAQKVPVVPATRDRAAELRQLLKDKTSFIRGSSDNYRAVEAALEAAAQGRKEPTPEQLRAIKAAAEKYISEKRETISAKGKTANSYESSRIEAVTSVLAYANQGLGLQAGENLTNYEEQRGKVHTEMSRGKPEEVRDAYEALADGKDAVDVQVERITNVYQPKLKLTDENETLKEQENKFTTFDDIGGVMVGGAGISDREFASLGVMAAIDKDIAGKWVTYRSNPIELDKGDPILAAEGVGTSYVGEFGRTDPRIADEMLENVVNKARTTAHDAVIKYRNGDKAPLAKLIGKGVRSTLDNMAHKMNDNKEIKGMENDQRAFNRLMFTAVDLAKRDPQLMKLAEKQGLTQKNLKRVEGLRRMDGLQHMAENAEKKLKAGNLTAAEKEACVDSMLCLNAMDTATRNAEALKTEENTPAMRQANEERQKWERLQEEVEQIQNNSNVLDEEKDIQVTITMQRMMGLQHAATNVPEPIKQLGGKDALVGLRRSVDELIPDQSGLLKLDGEQLLETLKDPKLVAPDEAAKQKYANIYDPPAQQPKVEQKQQGGPALMM